MDWCCNYIIIGACGIRKTLIRSSGVTAPKTPLLVVYFRIKVTSSCNMSSKNIQFTHLITTYSVRIKIYSSETSHEFQ